MILNAKQIYVLDDEPGVRQSIETILLAEGYQVKSFGRGTELIHYLDQTTFTAPSIALIDLRLPDMSGVSVMGKIKEKSPETEVIMLTGNPDLSSAVDSVNAGAYAYLLKPYNMDEIKNILEKILEKQRLVKDNKDLTDKLRSWNEKLEEEVHRRTVALNDSYQKLQRLYEMRTQFITIISHELRTPSTALMGFSDTLRDGWNTLSKEKIDKYLKIISGEAGRLVHLLNEIFEISRIQEGKLELTISPVEITAYLSQLINDYRNNYPEFSFAFQEKGDLIQLHVDPHYLKSALHHILLNAMKYSTEKNTMIIFTEKDEKYFTLRIEDEGPGIPTELKEKVFEPFFRSMDDVNRKTPGAGLGLSIARGILERMQGSVSVGEKRTGGKGCSIVIRLPLSS